MTSLETLADAIAARLGEVLRDRDRLLSKRELARALDVSEERIDRLMRRDELPASLVLGRSPRWDWQEVIRYLRGKVPKNLARRTKNESNRRLRAPVTAPRSTHGNVSDT